MGTYRRWSLVAAPAAAVIALSPAGSTGVAAAGASPQAAATHTAIAVPIRGTTHATVNDVKFGNLDYNGGPLMPSNTDYLVFWSPSGFAAYGKGSMPEYVTGLEQWFRDLAHDSGGNQNTDSVSAQYRDLTGAFSRYDTTFGGGLLDTDPYPPSECPVNAPVTHCMTDRQFQREIEHFVAARGLKTDLRHEYFIMTPPHVESCFSNQAPSYGGCSAFEVPESLAAYCAYHSNSVLSPMLFYANDPYVTGFPGCDDGNHPNGPSDGALVGGLSHEQNESVTDPIPNDAWTNGAGANHGLEIGDQCDGQNGTPLGRAPNGAKYNQVINGHFYWYQEEWSNQGHRCLQRLGHVDRAMTASFTVKAGSGLTLEFDASASSARDGIAEYVWQFNDSFGDPTIARTGPRISHTFPSAGPYSVGLTIFEPNGASAGTGGIVRTRHDGFTSGFDWSPSTPIAGQAVRFSAIDEVSAKTVKAYMWEFGDGSTGDGQHPRHVYARPGTYTITLVLFSGIGSAYPGAGAAPVTQRQITIA